MLKKVLVPIADGSEEIEAVCIIDVLRRAGAEVTVASVNDLTVTASRGLNLSVEPSGRFSRSLQAPFFFPVC